MSTGAERSLGELCAEAIRLGRVMTDLLPDEPEVLGLLALMLLGESGRAARTDATGDLVPHAEQDRPRWDPQLIAEGQALVQRCLSRNEPGPYQIQAAISAVHSDATSAATTAWDQIVELHDQLLASAPGPVAALNRAVAVAELEGPSAALAIVDALALESYYCFTRFARSCCAGSGELPRLSRHTRPRSRVPTIPANARSSRVDDRALALSLP